MTHRVGDRVCYRAHFATYHGTVAGFDYGALQYRVAFDELPDLQFSVNEGPHLWRETEVLEEVPF